MSGDNLNSGKTTEQDGKVNEIVIPLLYRVAGAIKTGMELCGSRWNNCESEVIACQAIVSCRLNHKLHGDAFSWCSAGLRYVGGMGIINNQRGLQILIDDGCIVAESYSGCVYPPEDTDRDESGKPLVLRVTQKLLEYAAFNLCEKKQRTEGTALERPVGASRILQ